MRFLVDENLPADVVDILRRDHHDVLNISESNHRGASDQELWRLGAGEGRIVTVYEPVPPYWQTPTERGKRP